ncbi:MAG: Crp/Fnr family transcriptional regulator [Oscillospiraceae bacterium]|nr:Crp/Fnr family transcriptional regulator [Eubacteriales bacterium]MDY2618424.1 Crp/Fnr family transcriptional regulator [Oscillospiraceae bacterium]
MLTAQELETVCASPLFQDYSPKQLNALLRITDCDVRRYARGAELCSPANFRKELAIVLSGQILVTKGGGELVVSALSPGDLYGAAALFNDEPDYVSTLTAKSAASVLTFSQETVQQLIDTQPVFRRSYIRYLSCRIRFLSGKIDALIQGSGEKKLRAWLVSQMDERSEILLTCSMTELAARLNIGRASLYRELQKLEERGALVRKGKRILVRDPAALDAEHRTDVDPTALP